MKSSSSALAIVVDGSMHDSGLESAENTPVAFAMALGTPSNSQQYRAYTRVDRAIDT